MIQASALDPDALLSAIGRDVPDSEKIDDLGYQFAFEVNDQLGAGLGSNLWEKAKEEFYVLVCTNEPRYEEIRKQASKVTPSYTTMLVAAVSAAFGSVIGIAATVITPLVGLLLLALAKVGKNAFCEAFGSN